MIFRRKIIFFYAKKQKKGGVELVLLHEFYDICTLVYCLLEI